MTPKEEKKPIKQICENIFTEIAKRCESDIANPEFSLDCIEYLASLKRDNYFINFLSNISQGSIENLHIIRIEERQSTKNNFFIQNLPIQWVINELMQILSNNESLPSVSAIINANRIDIYYIAPNNLNFALEELPTIGNDNIINYQSIGHSY